MMALDFPAAYVFTRHYEMFCFNLANTFGKAPLRWTQFIDDNPVEWASALGVTDEIPDARTGVQTFLRSVRWMEDLDAIQVPDTSSPLDPGWRTLPLQETNVNAAPITISTVVTSRLPR